MRYFLFLLLSMAVLLLPFCVIKTTWTCGLILFPGTVNGYFSGFLTTSIRAIALPAIATSTDNDLSVTKATIIKTT